MSKPLPQRKNLVLGLGLFVLWIALGIVAGLNDWGWVFVLAFGWAAGERWMAFWRDL